MLRKVFCALYCRYTTVTNVLASGEFFQSHVLMRYLITRTISAEMSKLVIHCMYEQQVKEYMYVSVYCTFWHVHAVHVNEDVPYS